MVKKATYTTSKKQLDKLDHEKFHLLYGNKSCKYLESGVFIKLLGWQSTVYYEPMLQKRLYGS